MATKKKATKKATKKTKTTKVHEVVVDPQVIADLEETNRQIASLQQKKEYLQNQAKISLKSWAKQYAERFKQVDAEWQRAGNTVIKFEVTVDIYQLSLSEDGGVYTQWAEEDAPWPGVDVRSVRVTENPANIDTHEMIGHIENSLMYLYESLERVDLADTQNIFKPMVDLEKEIASLGLDVYEVQQEAAKLL